MMLLPDKKSNAKFTIQFNRKNPIHMQVAELLNQQERGNKAQFIVDAVIFFMNNGGARDAQHSSSPPIDEHQVEMIVHRILQNKQTVNTGEAATPTIITASPVGEESLDTLGENEVTAVANALTMFRKK